MDDGVTLEMLCTERYHGFESHTYCLQGITQRGKMKKFIAALAAVVAMFILSAQPAAAYGPAIGSFWRQTDCKIVYKPSGAVFGNLHVTNYAKGPAGQTYHYALSTNSGFKPNYVSIDGVKDSVHPQDGYKSFNDRKYHRLFGSISGQGLYGLYCEKDF